MATKKLESKRFLVVGDSDYCLFTLDEAKEYAESNIDQDKFYIAEVSLVAVRNGTTFRSLTVSDILGN